MKEPSVVVALPDAAAAQNLAGFLQKYFPSVSVAASPRELQSAIARHRAHVAVVDVEMTPLQEVAALCRQFPATSVVAVHRLADESLWTAALAAGAADCCQNGDWSGIADSASRCLPRARQQAA